MSQEKSLNRLTNMNINFTDYCKTISIGKMNTINELKSFNSDWKICDLLRKKVTFSGKFMPFYGDTTVITLNSFEIDFLVKIQKMLYEKLPSHLASQLIPDYFHITIHDLSSSENEELIRYKLDENKVNIEKIFKQLAKHLKNYPEESSIELKANGLFSGNNTSGIVMGFIPSNDNDFRALMNIHNILDEIVYLDKLFIPHVTLAYFNPFGFSKQDVNELHNILTNFNNIDFSINLNFWNIAYQRFSNMNKYDNIYFLFDFK